MAGQGNRGPLGTGINSPAIDAGTNTLYCAPMPGPVGLSDAGALASITAPAGGTVFHPGVNHGHLPCGRWADIQKDPNSDLEMDVLCRVMTPRQLIDAATIVKFGDKPIALAHLNWYLTGKGVDLVEDSNIKTMLMTDEGVQKAIRDSIPPGVRKGKVAKFLKLDQSYYQNQDFRFAFGAIDQLDIEVDFGTGTIHVWFQDRYEWHPYYPGLYDVQSGDGRRSTNCVHAAAVELKSSGAADFWMKGEATVPLFVILPSRSSLGGGVLDL